MVTVDLLLVNHMIVSTFLAAHLRRVPAGPTLYTFVHVLLNDLIYLTLHVAEALTEVLLLDGAQLAALLHFLLR